MRILTFDIGGANTKRLLFDSRRQGVRSSIYYFSVWQRKKELGDFLRGLNIKSDLCGVTMTAELCDAFRDKTEGVEYIVDACEGSLSNPFYLTVEGEVIRKAEIRDPLQLASANWVASKHYLEKKFSKGILLDVGSTTTDILPFGCGVKPGRTDLERLQKGQLVYTGFLRTPVSAVVRRVPFQGGLTRISSEHFAITADVYNVLGMLADYSCSTPDGRGKSRKASMRRIARILCADLEEIGEEGITKICDYIYKEQSAIIAEALREAAKDAGVPEAYVCGVGSALGKQACALAGLSFKDLSVLTPAYDNLPCLGLMEILSGLGKV